MLGDRIVGLGSPHADDAIGWLAIERLRTRGGAQAELLTATPDRLTELCRGCRRLIVVDAARGDLPPGRVLRMVWPDPRVAICSVRSSHAIGLPEALQLADMLGWLPPQVVVFAVTACRTDPGAPLDDAVAVALAELEAQVLAELLRSQSEPPKTK